MEFCPGHDTFKERPLRYNSNQESAMPEKSNSVSIDSRMPWFTMSKGAERPNKIRTKNWTVTVELQFMKPKLDQAVVLRD